ncbi:hypothetical protein PF011_g2295 [Phytophthora fragariae]|uniref:Uncharacterized protein n=1 Tax=Phytophthora fragariae TaxID=53985 RepID=A0A6A3M8K7_9STRA|nr:hypothetical protein PF011_g2295 [Phytophthora fragariae]
MASTPGVPGPHAHLLAPASPRSDAASGHDTDTPGASAPAKRKFSHTTMAQRQCLLEWLELPGNFELLARRANTNDPNRPKKMDGYRSLAQYMNRVAHTQWSDKTARSRFESMMAAFFKAKRQNSDRLQALHQRLDALYSSAEGGATETRFRSESLGQKSESSRSPQSDVTFSELKTFVREQQSAGSPPRQRPKFMDESGIVTTTSTLSADVGAEESVTLAPLEPMTLMSSRPLTTVETTSMGWRPLAMVETTSMSSQTLAKVEMTPMSSQTLAKLETTSMGVQTGEPSTTLSSVQLDQAAMLESQRLAVRQQELALKHSELRARQEESRQKLRANVLTRLVEAGKSPAEVRDYLAIMDPVETPTPPRH